MLAILMALTVGDIPGTMPELQGPPVALTGPPGFGAFDLPQPGWPLRFVTLPDGSVQFADVDQDTGDDHDARTAIVVCTPRGWRDDIPSFGVTRVLWQHQPVNTDRIAAEIVQSDDGLEVDARELLDLAAPMVAAIRLTTGSQTGA